MHRATAHSRRPPPSLPPLPPRQQPIAPCLALRPAACRPPAPCRRALREEAPDLILGQAVQEFTLQNTCSEQGVDLRTYFTFNVSFTFFSEDVTSVIPGIFVDYFCDNIGQVGGSSCAGMGCSSIQP